MREKEKCQDIPRYIGEKTYRESCVQYIKKGMVLRLILKQRYPQL